MAALKIDDLSEETLSALRRRAKARGVSVEAEAKAILEEASGRKRTSKARRDPKAVQQAIARLYGGKPPKNAVEELIAERRREAEREARDRGR